MNSLDRHEIGSETAGVVIHHMAWMYDLGCYLVGMGKRFRRETLRFAQLQSGECVLNVGCGTGVLTRMAAERVRHTGEAIGIDPSEEMIKLAKRYAIKAQSEVDFQLGVIEVLPFEDERFDIVLSSMMLHHLPRELKVTGLKEIYRVLKPGGRLIVVDVDRPDNLPGRVLMFPWHNDPAVYDNLEGRVPELIKNTGFLNVHQTRAKWLGFIAFWLTTKPAN